MFYVLQIAPHEESRIEQILRESMPSSLCKQCFHPMRRRTRKIRGEWIETSEKLLPGYVFVETDNPEMFYKRLRTIPRLTKMLGKLYNEEIATWEFTGLSADEVRWLADIMSCGEDGQVSLSCVKKDTTGNIRIISGPRIAMVELSFGQRQSLLYFGIEIVD